MIKYLFLDLDNTILDFTKAESVAIRKTMSVYGLEPTDALARRYSEVNDRHWKALERGELTRDQVVVGRFAAFFGEQGIAVDAAAVAKTYETLLSQGHYFLPGAEEAVERLSKKYRLFLASNGTASVQKGRMTSANLYRFFETVFVSQEIGYNKPSVEYFNACFDSIAGFDKEKAIIVGDSLSSDIKGGINAGIDTCWYAPHGRSAPPDLAITYTVRHLMDIAPIILED